MNTFIITFGSRGDVQPYVALGKGLQESGHAVTICTAEQFEPFVREHGLDYGYMTGELLNLLDTDAGREAIEETVGIVGSVKTMVKLMRQTNPLNRQMLRDSWAAAQQVNPDLVIFHPKAIGAVSIAEAFEAPVIMAVLQPFYVPTAEFPAPAMPTLRLGGSYNRLTYKAVAGGFRMYRGMVDDLRREQMGLEKMPKGAGVYTTAAGQPIPLLHGFSAHVVPRPSDWPDYAAIPGYWFLESRDAYTPAADLRAFLDEGDAPVYIGFGSMAGKDPARLAQIVINAVRQAGVRAVLATGWGGLQAADLPQDIFKIEKAPHEWLFPQMAAVVHHGGAGTTGAGLRAARPTVVVPFMGDQPFWGSRVYDLGVGPQPIPQKKLTAENLAAAILKAVSDPTMRQKAETLGRQISAEDGVSNAVTLIDSYLEQPIPAS